MNIEETHEEFYEYQIAVTFPLIAGNFGDIKFSFYVFFFSENI